MKYILNYVDDLTEMCCTMEHLFSLLTEMCCALEHLFSLLTEMCCTLEHLFSLGLLSLILLRPEVTGVYCSVTLVKCTKCHLNSTCGKLPNQTESCYV